MTGNSTRVYWMTDKSWYELVDGEIRLTPEAPPQAERSYAEWRTPGKIPVRLKLKYIRTKLKLMLKVVR